MVSLANKYYRVYNAAMLMEADSLRNFRKAVADFGNSPEGRRIAEGMNSHPWSASSRTLRETAALPPREGIVRHAAFMTQDAWIREAGYNFLLSEATRLISAAPPTPENRFLSAAYFACVRYIVLPHMGSRDRSGILSTLQTSFAASPAVADAAAPLIVEMGKTNEIYILHEVVTMVKDMAPSDTKMKAVISLIEPRNGRLGTLLAMPLLINTFPSHNTELSGELVKRISGEIERRLPDYDNHGHLERVMGCVRMSTGKASPAIKGYMEQKLPLHKFEACDPTTSYSHSPESSASGTVSDNFFAAEEAYDLNHDRTGTMAWLTGIAASDQLQLGSLFNRVLRDVNRYALQLSILLSVTPRDRVPKQVWEHIGGKPQGKSAHSLKTYKGEAMLCSDAEPRMLKSLRSGDILDINDQLTVKSVGTTAGLCTRTHKSANGMIFNKGGWYCPMDRKFENRLQESMILGRPGMEGTGGWIPIRPVWAYMGLSPTTFTEGVRLATKEIKLKTKT